MKFNLDMFKMGYVILYKKGENDKFFGEQIVKAQVTAGFSKEQSQYTHVEISGGDQHSINIRPPKSLCVDIREAHAGRYIKLLRPKIYDNDGTNRKRLKVAYISASLNNLNYDIMGVLKFKIPFFFHKEKEFFCSEACTYSIQHQFKDFMNGVDPYKVMPAEYGLQKWTDVIWQGYIS